RRMYRLMTRTLPELVVEADVASRHRRPKGRARCTDAGDRALQLVVDGGHRWVAEVEVVRDAERSSPHAGDVPRGFGNSVRCAEERVEVHVARVAVDGRSYAEGRALHAQHGRVGLTGQDDAVGHH